MSEVGQLPRGACPAFSKDFDKSSTIHEESQLFKQWSTFVQRTEVIHGLNVKSSGERLQMAGVSEGSLCRSPFGDLRICLIFLWRRCIFNWAVSELDCPLHASTVPPPRQSTHPDLVQPWGLMVRMFPVGSVAARDFRWGCEPAGDVRLAGLRWPPWG